MSGLALVVLAAAELDDPDLVVAALLDDFGRNRAACEVGAADFHVTAGADGGGDPGGVVARVSAGIAIDDLMVWIGCLEDRVTRERRRGQDGGCTVGVVQPGRCVGCVVGGSDSDGRLVGLVQR